MDEALALAEDDAAAGDADEDAWEAEVI